MDFILSSLKNQFNQQQSKPPSQPPSQSQPSSLVVSPPSAPHSNLFVDVATTDNDNDESDSFFHTQPFPVANVAIKKKVKQEFLSNETDDDDDDDLDMQEIDNDNNVKPWHIPESFISSSSTSPPSSSEKQQQQHDITPYLYRVLVVDFYNNVSNQSGIPFTDLFDIEFFLTIPCPITDSNIFSNTLVFDNWFIRCCKNPFLIERAWSLVVALNPRKFTLYGNLILCRNTQIRTYFAELCACMYLDTKIETSTWKFSIHNLDEENERIMTFSKNEIKQHEARKARLFLFFKSDSLVIRHVSSSLVLTNVATEITSKKLFPDVSIDTYTSLLQSSIKEIGIDPFHKGNNNNNTITYFVVPPRDHLLLLEKGAANQSLAQPWMFKTDEISIIDSINTTLGIENTDMDLIINDTFARILFAAAVGYSYRKRRMQSIMLHVPKSMQARLANSKLALEIQLAKIYLRLSSSISSNNNRR